MSTPALFEGFDDATAQWRLTTMQLVNWGGFHGHHSIDFGHDATLISGGSGTGKSTILDAYLALMMPTNVPFNGASNDATTGRARSATQRNVLSYLRGKIDSTRQGDEITDTVLRGGDAPIWGAIAATFTDDSDRVLTVLRTFIAPAGATNAADVRMRMFTVAADVDVSELDRYAETRFDVRRMRETLPSIESHETPGKFLEYVTTRLGIGGVDSGDNALRLLARVQAGHQVRTVDRLFKELVLERPATFGAADRALEQFRALNQTYEDIRIAEEKQRVLSPIRELDVERREALARTERLDRLGVNAHESAFGLWSLLTERDLLDRDESRTRIEKERAQAEKTAADARISALNAQLEVIDQEIRDNGGNAMQVLESQLEQARADLARKQLKRSEFLDKVQALALDTLDADSFAELRAVAQAHAGSSSDSFMALQAERDRVVAARGRVDARLQALKEERASLGSRAGRVPVEHDEARRRIAEAAGVDPRDLPFAAELMDIAPEFAEWRRAAEDTLRGVGLTMLIDERRAPQIRRVMDTFVAGQAGELGLRLQNQAVPVDVPFRRRTDTRYISGRLVFQDGPFTGWLAEHVASDAVDHLCVQDAADLEADEPTVTINGQTRRGSRGAHGRALRQRDVLGFSGEMRMSEIAEEAVALDGERTALAAQLQECDERLDAHNRRSAAFGIVLSTAWDDIDAATVAEQVAGLREQYEALTTDSDALQQLQARRAELVTEREDQRAVSVIAGKSAIELDAEWGRVVDRKDDVATLLDAIERRESATLDEADRASLAAESARLGGDFTRADLPRVIALVREAVSIDLAAAEQSAARAEQALIRSFEMFDSRWPDLNRGSGIDAFDEYEAILDEIVRNGLPQRLEAFRRSFQKWSGDDLKLLSDQYQRALDAIDERLDPINDILRGTPFGAGGQDRLRIEVRHSTPEYLARFRRQLDRLSSASLEWSDAEAESRFVELRDFMTQIDVGVNGSTLERDRLLDVRQHIEISASRVSSDGRVVSTYTDIAGKSGGETQELVAFIVGSALRYQLGDERRAKPRFATVILDEGFVKSDSEFAGRAVTAWRDLGFQLIIAAPLDKVTGLEPHVDVMWSVTKSAEMKSYVTPFRRVAV